MILIVEGTVQLHNGNILARCELLGVSATRPRSGFVPSFHALVQIRMMTAHSLKSRRSLLEKFASTKVNCCHQNGLPAYVCKIIAALLWKATGAGTRTRKTNEIGKTKGTRKIKEDRKVERARNTEDTRATSCTPKRPNWKLPSQILQDLAKEYLEPIDRAALSIPCTQILNILGTQHLTELRENDRYGLYDLLKLQANDSTNLIACWRCMNLHAIDKTRSLLPRHAVMPEERENILPCWSIDPPRYYPEVIHPSFNSALAQMVMKLHRQGKKIGWEPCPHKDEDEYTFCNRMFRPIGRIVLKEYEVREQGYWGPPRHSHCRQCHSEVQVHFANINSSLKAVFLTVWQELDDQTMDDEIRPRLRFHHNWTASDLTFDSKRNGPCVRFEQLEDFEAAALWTEKD